MADVEKYPLDAEALQKGQVLSVAQLERITGEECGTEAYRLAVLGLRDWIMRERRLMGLPVTVATCKGTLAVLTDAEAAVYNHRLQSQRVRQLFAAHLRQLEVDATALDDEQRREHEQAVINDSRMVQALLGEKKKIALEPCRRTVPGIIADQAG